MKKSEKKVINYFKSKGWNPLQKKPNGYSWYYIGREIGLSPEGARAAHKRYRLSSSLNQSEKAFMEELEKVEFVEDLPTTPLNKKCFTMPGLHIILGCCHIPFHNKTIFKGIYSLLEDLGDEVKGFHLAGDFLDLNSLSSHDRGRFTAIPGLTLNQEYTAGNEVLDIFDSLLPKDIEKSFLFGNHCARALKYNADMQNAKTPVQTPTGALKLYERGYNVHEKWDQDMIQLGDHLHILHGIYWNQYATKKHLDVFRKSCLFYHTHRIQSYVEGHHAAFNGGFLGDINSPAFNYASMGMKSQWQNGFNIVYISDNGNFFMNQIIVANNKFVYNGKQY